jgi:hypothetical protein
VYGVPVLLKVIPCIFINVVDPTLFLNIFPLPY